MKIILVVLIIFLGTGFPQSTDPEKILEKVKLNFNKVQDYEVNIKIKVDVDYIKVPVSEAKIYYKQPDKIHIKSDKFALIPREGLDFSPVSLLKGKYTSIYQGNETIDNKILSIIKIIPLEDRGDIILTTVWVDQSKAIIRKIETSTKTSGTFIIDLKYDEKKTDYPLPSAMIFTFNLEQMNIPKGMTGEMNSKTTAKEKEKKSPGKVYIHYSDYQVNKGIPDNVFEGEKK